jgi:oligopeptidase B
MTRSKTLAGLIVSSIILVAFCQTQTSNMIAVHPPKAKKISQNLEIHGDIRTDNYYWLRNRDQDEVLEYLRRENEYYHALTAHTSTFQDGLFSEMKARIKEDDESVPYKQNGYWYLTRFEKGREYPVYSRKKGSLEAREEILFNCNELAIGQEYFDLKGLSVSPDNNLAAFGTDTVSRRQYYIQVKDLKSGELYPDKIENTTGSSVWANDSRTLYYTKKDPVTLRSDKVFRHVLGTPPEEDQLVYHEDDETFYTYVTKSKSKKYLIIGSVSTLTSEYRILEADYPEGDFRLFSPRVRGLEYSIYHYRDTFYILTNKDGATNFKVMLAREGNTAIEQWQEFIPHRENILLEDLEIFREFYVVAERDNGLTRIKVNRWDSDDSYYLPFNSETYVAYPYVNPEFDTDTLRYVYNSMTSPYAVIDLNMGTRETRIMKEQEVLGGSFDKEDYRSERKWATARDGVRIPISLVYHKDTPLTPDTPLFLHGYGSYGATLDPYFSTVRLSLLNRGFVYAIAHVRGGEYLGRQWYEDGKLLNKRNTFNDFIDCSKYLIGEHYTRPGHLYAYGGSAGGLLMGVVLNEAPDLYKGVIAAVPFVDVITTMLDESIPLTTGEYDEWGNPNDEKYYRYMKSYSPYDNVRTQDYPNILVTTGLHDSQVQYWEPAKWVAKLREYKTDKNLIFLETNLDAGHGGASGRFEALKETAKEYAFLLDLEGKIQ